MADVYYAICSDAFWGTPNWAGKGSEAARDTYYDGHYTSCATWESARDGAASVGDTEYGEICGTWASADSSQLTFYGWPSNVTIILKTVGDARHSGKWDDTDCHRLVMSSGTYVLYIADENVNLDGLQIRNTVMGDGSSYGIYSDYSVTGIKISNCILSFPGAGYGIRLNDVSITADIWNCIIYSTATGSAGIYIDSVDTCNIYNSVFKNFSNGLLVDAVGSSASIKNCAVYNNADDFNDGVGITIDYCASDDGDGSNSVDAPTWADQFTDDSTYDFSLKSGNSLEDAGTDDPGSGLYSNDIAGTAYTSTWPIGAFEEAASGAVTVEPACVNIAITVPTPTVTAQRVATVQAGLSNIAVTVPAPTVVAQRAATVQADVSNIAISIPAPTVTAQRVATIQAAASNIAVSMPAPTVTAQRAATVQAGLSSIAVSMPAPTVIIGSGVYVNAACLEIAVTIPAPTVVAQRAAAVQAEVTSIAVTVPAPTVIAQRVAIVQVGVCLVVVSMPAPGVVIGEIEIYPQFIKYSKARDRNFISTDRGATKQSAIRKTIWESKDVGSN